MKDAKGHGSEKRGLFTGDDPEFEANRELFTRSDPVAHQTGVNKIGKVYHSTPADNRASIERSGLLASKAHAGEGALYFSSEKPKPRPNIDVWEVSTAGLHLESDDTGRDDPDSSDKWLVQYGQDVPRSNLKRIA
jgi:hypothetical protein